jgi:predicted peptidase
MNLLKYFILLAILLALNFHSLNAQLLKNKSYDEYRYKGMRYGLFTPNNLDASKSYPLIVYLHGSRDTVSRELIWYGESVQGSNPCFVLTPKCEESDQGWGNTWSDGHTEATTKTLALVDSLIKHHNINVNRLYLYGISMGGFGVFSILSKERGKFAAGYSVCGGSKVSAADKLVDTPLWIFHGEMDDIVPVSLSRDIYKEIIKLGGRKVRYTEYPGVKHNSWENVSREKSLNDWLFAQKKVRQNERTPLTRH